VRQTNNKVGRISTFAWRVTGTNVLLGSSLILLALTRGPNSLMLLLFALSLLFLRNEVRDTRLQLFVIFSITFFTALTYTLSAHNAKSNIGLNLHTFIERACTFNPCKEKIFKQENTPIISTHWEKNKTISGVRAAFDSAGHGPFSPTYSTEMRRVYLRLIRYAPASYVSQIIKNWRDQLNDKTIAIYPEDTNLKLLASTPFKTWAEVSTWFSIAMAAVAPLVLLAGAVRIIISKSSVIEAYFVAWLGACLSSSLIIFAASWITDSSRIRFHFEFQVFLLLFIFSSSYFAALASADGAKKNL
jgi:hypothetical protein